jgi:hypothetical protein
MVSSMFLIINVCRLFLLFPRVTVISFMASEIDRLESSTLQMLIDSIDQVVDVGYQFGLVCSIHRCLTDDVSYFV